MSKIGNLEKMLFDYFNDDKIYKISDFNKKAVELKIIDENDSNSVKNTLYKLKRNKTIKAIGQGQYIILKTEENGCDDDLTVEKACAFLYKKLKSNKEMNVIKNSYEELQKAKKDCEIYNKYKLKIEKLMNN